MVGAAEALGAEAAGDADEAEDGRGAQPMLVCPRVRGDLAHDEIDVGDDSEAGSCWLKDRPQILTAGDQMTAIAALSNAWEQRLERRVRDPPPQPLPPSPPPSRVARTSSDVA